MPVGEPAGCENSENNLGNSSDNHGPVIKQDMQERKWQKSNAENNRGKLLFEPSICKSTVPITIRQEVNQALA